jgi:hypothetical protein
MRFHIFRTSAKYPDEETNALPHPLPDQYLLQLDKLPPDDYRFLTDDDKPGFGWFIDINTIQELVKLQIVVGHNLIFSENEIEIYDGYRE